MRGSSCRSRWLHRLTIQGGIRGSEPWTQRYARSRRTTFTWSAAAEPRLHLCQKRNHRRIHCRENVRRKTLCVRYGWEIGRHTKRMPNDSEHWASGRLTTRWPWILKREESHASTNGRASGGPSPTRFYRGPWLSITETLPIRTQVWLCVWNSSS